MTEKGKHYQSNGATSVSSYCPCYWENGEEREECLPLAAPVLKRIAGVILWGTGNETVLTSPYSSLMGHRRNSVGKVEVDFLEHQPQQHRNRI